MSAQPNITKSIIDALKERGVKASLSGKRAIAVDSKTIATAYEAKRGVRLFVTDSRGKLPAALAKPFKLNKTRGYALLVKFDDDIKPAVDAIAHVAALAPATKTPPKPKTTPAKTTPAKTAAKSPAKSPAKSKTSVEA